MKKTIALVLAAILLLSLAACGQTAQPAEPAATEVPAEAPAEVESSAEPDNSNVDYSLRVAQMGTSIKAAMVVLANEMGYYAEEGLDVTFEPINNLNDGITAILGGSLDILPFGVIPTCTFVAQGADLTVIGGTIAEREKLFVQTPTSFGTRFRIDVRVESEAVAVDPAAKTVTVRRADGSTYTEPYDKLLLSPGASPVRPPLQGIGTEGIFTLRNVDDTDRIKTYMATHRIGRAVVVGAGFIGLEMAENLHRTGAHVSIIEMGNQVMAPVDFSIASHVHQHLLQKGVALYLEQSVERFEKQGEQVAVVFLSLIHI